MAARMQQRRGTAAQWTSANPVLGSGEIGFETDTSKFKIGDGTSTWSNLTYFANLNEVLDGAPDLLNTLNEIAAAIGDDPNFITTIESSLDLKADITYVDASYEEIMEDIGAINTALNNKQNIVANVSDDEIGHLNGVTSSIQTQIDAKQDKVTDVSDTEIGYLNGVTSAIQTQFTNLETIKADLAGPTFTGSVILPTTTAIGDVSSDEIGYLNGVTSALQTQIDAKLGSATAAGIYAPLNDPTFGGTVSLPGTTSIGNVSSTELGYLDGVTSSIQTQIDSKAPSADPTFTGTVTGVTKAHVGLTNVDDTSDADKPVSTATQTALDTKLNLAGGTMTGKITLDGDPTQALHAVTKQYLDSVEAGLITRPAVKAATTANLSGTYTNGTAGVDSQLNLGQLATLDIDGVTAWSQYNGILVKNQTNAFENGRYVVLQIGNDTDTDWILKRCPLCDEADEIPGSYIFVTDGAINEQTGWVQHVADPSTFTVGTDSISVYQFAGAGSVTAGTNISVTGNQVSVLDAPVFTGIVDASAAGVEFSDGVQTQAGVPSLTTFVEKTASYQLDTLDHKDNVVEMNMSTAGTFTVPLDATLAWPVGASVDIFATGTGAITIAAEAGVTLNATPGLILRTQWSSATIMKRGADNWVVYGDLKA
jgi:hypothetical protein